MKATTKGAVATRGIRNGKLPRRLLQEIVDRIVRVAQPEKIILFGSAARDEMGPNSDVDVLVIKERGRYQRHALVGRIYNGLHGVEAAVDVILITPEQLKKYRDCPYSVIRPALREGRVVYAT